MQTASRPFNLWTNVLLVSFLLSMLAACDQSPIHVNNDNATAPQLQQAGGHVPVVEGRLAFRDMEAFSDFMKAFVSPETASLDKLPFQDGFISLRTVTEQLMDEVEKTLLDAEGAEQLVDGVEKTLLDVEEAEQLEIVEDPYFAAVLNKDGEIRIGSDVFKVTRNYVYRTPQSSVESLKDIDLRHANHTPILSRQGDGVESYEIERAGYAAASGAVGKSMVDRTCTSYFTTKRRIQGKSWITDYWLYASAGARTKSQRKRWYGWRSNSINQVRIQSDYSLTDSDGNTSEDDYDHSVYNGTQIETIFMTDSGWSATITGNIDTDHSGNRDGVWRSCSAVVSRSG